MRVSGTTNGSILSVRILGISCSLSGAKMRVLEALGYPPNPNPALDFLLTGIVLVGGRRSAS